LLSGAEKFVRTPVSFDSSSYIRASYAHSTLFKFGPGPPLSVA